MTKREFLNYCVDKNGPQILINRFSELKKVISIAKKFDIDIENDIDTVDNKSEIIYPFLVEFHLKNRFLKMNSNEYHECLVDKNWIQKPNHRIYSDYVDFYSINRLQFSYSKLDENFFEIHDNDSEENIDIKNKVLNYKKTLLK